MIARRSGNIINISSQAGRGGFARRSPYCVAKWGIIGLTQTLAVETGEYNIRVNGIAPGPVEGERIENVLKAEAEATGLTYQAVRNRSTAKAALRRMVTVTEIADIALFLVSEQSSGITGETFDVNAGSRIRV